MASCLYCVPYHSSVLSVCPSNDFDTTATLERKKCKPCNGTWIQKPLCQKQIMYVLFHGSFHKIRYVSAFLLISHLDHVCGREDPSTHLPVTELCLEFLKALSVLHLECVSLVPNVYLITKGQAGSYLSNSQNSV